jgi:hypothetical protein
MDINRKIDDSSSYGDKLFKLIPSEIVAAFMAINGFLATDIENNKWTLLVAAILLLALIPIYLQRIYKIFNLIQIGFTMGSYIVWIYSIGGPFKYFDLYNASLASTILVFWTLLIPLIDFESEFKVGQSVRIVARKPKPAIRKDGAIDWNPEKSKFLGKDAVIMKNIRKMRAVKLDIDAEVNTWAYEWITKIEKDDQNGEQIKTTIRD